MSIQFTARPTPSRRPLVLTVGLVVVLAIWYTLAPVFGAFATTASLTGVVFEDLDEDGVRDQNEPTWSDQGVEVWTLDETTQIAKALTDGDGRYRVDGLEAGTYIVKPNGSQWQAYSTSQSYHPQVLYITTNTYGFDAEVLPIEGETTFNLGWGEVTKHQVESEPMSVATSSRGTVVQSYVDAVDAAAIASAVDGFLQGREAAATSVYFGLYDGYSTASTNDAKTHENFSARLNVSYEQWRQSRQATLSHEYGHAWAEYHDNVVQQDGTYAGYLEARGLTGDSRLGSNRDWTVGEMIAEDYRQLFGGLLARRPQANEEIPPAEDIPGLGAYLSGEFMSGSSTDDSGSTDTTSSDTQPPNVAEFSPTDGSTVSGTTTAAVTVSDDVTSSSELDVTVLLAGVAHAAAFDGSTGQWKAAIDTTAVSDGTVSLEVRATDASGNTATASHGVVVDNTSNADGDDTTTSSTTSTAVAVSTTSGQVNNGDTWLAWVDVTVTDGGAAAPGTLVEATWAGSGKHGGSGSVSCTTADDGACRLTVSQPKRVDTVMFSVTSPASAEVAVVKP